MFVAGLILVGFLIVIVFYVKKEKRKWISIKNEFPPLDEWVEFNYFDEIYTGKVVCIHGRHEIIYKSELTDGYISNTLKWKRIK